MIQIKRAYEAPSANDGRRFLVDALWPRGLKKDDLRIEGWVKDVAPSRALRQWFGHDPARWAEFQQRYNAELRQCPEAWHPLLDAARKGRLTLVFGARDAEHNNAVALRSVLKKRL